MTIYQHIILGLDLYPACNVTVIKKAQALATKFSAELTVVHAVEHIATYGIGQAYPGILDIEGDLVNTATIELARVCGHLGIDTAHQIVRVGITNNVLFEVAREKNADLIVIGSHGRHGLQLLLGSTANAVLHHATCDVLAIRIRDDDATE